MIAALLAMAIVVTTMVTTARTASADPVGPFPQVPWIVNNNDHRCIHVSSAADEIPVRGRSCSTAPNKGWVFTWVGSDPDPEHFGDYYQIRNHDTGKCLLMRNWGSAANKGVQYPCLGYADQYWYVDLYPDLGGLARIWNKNSGLCLVLRSWQTQVEGSQCANYADQLWQIG